jgi:hypothetical protein
MFTIYVIKKEGLKMKVKCPICKKNGSMQQRYNSVRVGHYKGFEGKTRIVEWHCTTIKDVLVNNGSLMVNSEGRVVNKNDCLPSSRKIMSLAP